ncbi:MAG: hypothetical protein AVO33_10840 [delta proteobacterium ML8_F1]|nr:MAG: hypothetical protein AVO33_10840 [delta proteobacterium ML8_F1]
MNYRTLTVTETNHYIRGILSADPILNALKVQGEISGFKPHASGHAYFTLKDDKSRINCVMFASHYQTLTFKPKEGDLVVLFGKVGIYDKNGTYQLYVTRMTLSGMGALYEKFLKLKEDLGKEGLFDEAHKRPLPQNIKKVGVITSRTGAALQDVIAVCRRRNPLLELIVIPATVQGEKTETEVLGALDEARHLEGLDLIILTRGGGAYDELSVFNSEAIARKIYGMNLPVISAIGHETDFTIVDFVSDLRAPTPSAAAEIVAVDLGAVLGEQRAALKAMKRLVTDKVRRREEALAGYQPQTLGFPLEKRLADMHYSFAEWAQRTVAVMNKRIDAISYELNLTMERINGVNPLNILDKGYARLEKTGGGFIRSVKTVKAGDAITNELKDGKILSVVERIEVSHEKEEY